MPFDLCGDAGAIFVVQHEAAAVQLDGVVAGLGDAIVDRPLLQSAHRFRGHILAPVVLQLLHQCRARPHAQSPDAVDLPQIRADLPGEFSLLFPPQQLARGDRVAPRHVFGESPAKIAGHQLHHGRDVRDGHLQHGPIGLRMKMPGHGVEHFRHHIVRDLFQHVRPVQRRILGLPPLGNLLARLAWPPGRRGSKPRRMRQPVGTRKNEFPPPLGHCQSDQRGHARPHGPAPDQPLPPHPHAAHPEHDQVGGYDQHGRPGEQPRSLRTRGHGGVPFPVDGGLKCLRSPFGRGAGGEGLTGYAADIGPFRQSPSP